MIERMVAWGAISLSVFLALLLLLLLVMGGSIQPTLYIRAGITMSILLAWAIFTLIKTRGDKPSNG